MIPNALRRRSVKAVAQYILHDKDRAVTSERVAWTHTLNMATDNPEKAWRLIARTVYRQDAMKADAGVKAGGQKLEKPVYHMMLMWHPQEVPSQEHMIETAKSALRALGIEHHQVLMVAHRDEPQAHVHLLVNRIDPKTGKAANLSNDRTILQEWAATYESEHGVFCWARLDNIERRQAGEYVRFQRKDSANPERRAERAAAQAIEAREKIADEAYLLRILTQEKTSFLAMEAKELLVRMNNALPEGERFKPEQLNQKVLRLVHPANALQLADGRYVPNELLAIEQRFVERAGEMAYDRSNPIETSEAVPMALARGLNNDQAVAVLRLVQGGRMMMFEAIAGSDKSQVLGVIREIYEEQGKRVIGLGPTNAVVNGLKQDGFEARTVHSALAQQEAPFRNSDHWDRNTLVVLDEAVDLGTRRLEELQRKVYESGAKLILAGDNGAFPPIKQAHGLWQVAAREAHPIRLERNVRQAEGDARVAAAFRAGDHGQALDLLRETGQVRTLKGSGQSETDRFLKKEVYDDPRIQWAVADFMYEATLTRAAAEKIDERYYAEHGLTALSGEAAFRMAWRVQDERRWRDEVINLIEFETDLLTGTDDDKEREAVRLRIGEGDRIVFGETNREAGIIKGMAGFVRSTEDRAAVKVALDDGRNVAFDIDQMPGTRLGYAMSLYQARGFSFKTNRAVVTQAWRGYAAYVAASLHTEENGLTLYHIPRPDGVKLESQLALTEGEGAAIERLKEAETLARWKEKYPSVETTPFAGKLRELAKEVVQGLVSDKASFAREDVRRGVMQGVTAWEEAAKPHGEALEALARETVQHRDIIRLNTGRYSTRQHLELEHGIMMRAMDMRGDRRHLVGAGALDQDLQRQLNAEQYRAVKGVLQDGALSFIEGYAGTGKTRTFEKLRDVYRAEGFDVRAMAPTAAVAGDLSQLNIDSRTLHSALKQQSDGSPKARWTSQTVLLVDEAAMIDTRMMGRLTAEAERAGAKLVMAFDRRQFDPVGGPGGMAGAMADQFGSHVLADIQRQRKPWMQEASSAIARGDAAAAVDAYADKRRIRFAEDASQARAQMTAAYLERSRPDLTLERDAREAKQAEQMRETAALVYRRADMDAINKGIRQARIERGDIEAGQVFQNTDGLTKLSVGDRIIFTQNQGELRNNDLGMVTGLAEDRIEVRRDRDGKSIAFNPEQYEQWRHGYATTLHAAQGRTVNHTIMLHSDDWQQEASYVGMTRHRDDMVMVVNKQVARDRRDLKRQLGDRRNQPAAIMQMSELQRRAEGFGLVRSTESRKEPEALQAEQRRIEQALDAELLAAAALRQKQGAELDRATQSQINRALLEHRAATKERYPYDGPNQAQILHPGEQRRRQEQVEAYQAEGNIAAAVNMQKRIIEQEAAFKQVLRELKEREALYHEQAQHIRARGRVEQQYADIAHSRARLEILFRHQHELAETFGPKAPLVRHPSVTSREKADLRAELSRYIASRDAGWRSRAEVLATQRPQQGHVGSRSDEEAAQVQARAGATSKQRPIMRINLDD